MINFKVYETPVRSREELQHRVENVTATISLAEIEKVKTIEVQTRLRCVEVEGRHFEHL